MLMLCIDALVVGHTFMRCCIRSARDLQDYAARVAWAGVIDVSADARAIWGLLMSSYMNLLLVAVPLGFAAQLLGWSAGLRFSLVSCRSQLVQLQI
jgi:hypothetical protein